MIDKFSNQELKECICHTRQKLEKVNFLASQNSWKQNSSHLRDHSTVIRDFVNIALSNKHREVTVWSCNKWYELISQVLVNPISQVFVISQYRLCFEVFVMPNYLICCIMGELTFLLKRGYIWLIKQEIMGCISHTNYNMLLKYQTSAEWKPPENLT